MKIAFISVIPDQNDILIWFGPLNNLSVGVSKASNVMTYMLPYLIVMDGIEDPSWEEITSSHDYKVHPILVDLTHS